ncbi:sorting nexin-14-like isoform X2 [Anthonomus grandis grandis]|uniref:sorting nexin-14-like isoform X2 n=1 Tax=Anthonomus grandis grandis TaxID=2921223 RepID=UPI00216587B0|nr:sorting nexin-14-like isoform X2 [Anthonomus grandis grandis]
MFYQNIAEILKLVSKDKYIRISASVIITLCLITSIFYSSFLGLLIISSYILGYIGSYLLIEYHHYVTTYIERFLSFYSIRSATKNKLRGSCSVCDDLSCKRHQIGQGLAPWKHIRISEELNSAVEHFYNRILDNFICSWYSEFTENKEFLNELRYCLRHGTATLVNRIFEVEYIDTITNKLVPQAIKHIDDYLYMEQIATLKNVKFNDVIVEYLGKNLHPATTNRRNELAYLQHLSSEIIKNLLPMYYTNCKNSSVLIRELLSGWVLLPLMDVLADPNIINSLVIIAVNYKSNKSQKNVQPIKEVEFLHDFVQVEPLRTSPFATSLSKIKNDTELLYAFMQFLKKQEQVHLLQFCLDVDDFNTKLLTPDLSKKELKELHEQALKLHKEYLNDDSYNFIGCSDTICKEFSELIDDIYTVAKLRTSKPLYQAYDFAFNHLESIWMPQFFHSNEFYNYICGTKVTSTYSKASIKSKKYYEQSNYRSVSKLSSSFGKIKGVLKASTPVEGSLEPVDVDFPEEIILNENHRDLSNWKITIPTYQTIPANKITYFCLNVLHLDTSLPEGKVNNWIVWRKDQDFFTLKAKLVEFHGENEICDSPLPSRKAGVMIESRMSKYEDFVTKLLQKPSLRGSDLLHTFLTSEEDFTLVISTMAPNNQDVGNIYQSVAYKLRKEKGQNLDSFISTFVTSVMKQKNDKIDLAEEGLELAVPVDCTPPIPKTFKSAVFKDNLGISYKLQSGSSNGTFSPSMFSESLFYLLKNVFKIRPVILRIYVAFCNVAQQIIDLLSKLFIDKKIKAGLTQHNLAYLLGLLEGVIFNNNSQSTPQGLAERKANAFKDIQFCPNFVNNILGGQVNKGLVNLLEILQNPNYNKQLAYNLLDIIVLELFPELIESK